MTHKTNAVDDGIASIAQAHIQHALSKKRAAGSDLARYTDQDVSTSLRAAVKAGATADAAMYCAILLSRCAPIAEAA